MPGHVGLIIRWILDAGSKKDAKKARAGAKKGAKRKSRNRGGGGEREVRGGSGREGDK
jgi:hypothetical protein